MRISFIRGVFLSICLIFDYLRLNINIHKQKSLVPFGENNRLWQLFVKVLIFIDLKKQKKKFFIYEKKKKRNRNK